MLFGDTWPAADAVCQGTRPTNDDTVATLPLAYSGGVPIPRFVADPNDPNSPSTVHVFRDGQSLDLGYGQVPIAGFSDGQHVFAIFERLVPLHCDDSFATGAQACPTQDHFICSQQLGICDPPAISFPQLCDAVRNQACLPGQNCVPATLCVDPTSSQNDDGHFGGLSSSVASGTDIGMARSLPPVTFDSIFTWPTNKFSHVTTHTVAKWSGGRNGNDYRTGHDALFVWGRPRFIAEHGRQAQLYLMWHSLPLTPDTTGKLTFRPHYFAGVDPQSGEPTWTALESQAVPIALDGKPGGDPHETLQLIGPMTIAWLDAPINKWVMLYGGDLADYLMMDPASTRSLRAPGAIAIRFADHPWGPFSPPQPLLGPGSPLRPGDPSGPGGFLFNPDCSDGATARCAPSDPIRPVDSALPGCPFHLNDPGWLYAPNIVEPYTQPNSHGGLDMIWNVSSWNPYGVQWLRTSILPPGHAPTRDELADARGLQRLAAWRDLPKLEPQRRYEQQSSHDRGTSDHSFPLSDHGNRDFNNFICASADAKLGANQFTPFRFDEPTCPESYVKGAVLARFEGAGRLVRSWIAMTSLLLGPADDEFLRIYVDDDPQPRVAVPLAEALDGRAGEIFAPPFGAGSPLRLAWYYPIAFQHKLIVSLDGLGDYDEYYYQHDVVRDDAPAQPVPPELRNAAANQLSELFQPAGTLALLHDPQALALAPGASAQIALDGPATVYELRVRSADADFAKLAQVQLRVRWDGASTPAIDVSLADLFGGGVIAPERSSLALTSALEQSDRVLALKLPMPFAQRAAFELHNDGTDAVALELRLLGEHTLAADGGTHLHMQRHEVIGPTDASDYVAVSASGPGRLVGVCLHVEGRADPAGSFESDPLNVLEGDVRATVDGAAALNGTGTEEYADDVFYFKDAPRGNAFVQSWGVVSDANDPPGRASLCRWHVLGTELDFQRSLELRIQLGGAGNPQIVLRHRAISYLYQRD